MNDQDSTRQKDRAKREERLAAELRENLKKRKAQARARQGGGGKPQAEGTDSE